VTLSSAALVSVTETSVPTFSVAPRPFTVTGTPEPTLTTTAVPPRFLTVNVPAPIAVTLPPAVGPAGGPWPPCAADGLCPWRASRRFSGHGFRSGDGRSCPVCDSPPRTAPCRWSSGASRTEGPTISWTAGAGTQVLDAAAPVDEAVLPQSLPPRRIPTLLVLPTCSTTQLGINPALLHVAATVALDVGTRPTTGVAATSPATAAYSAPRSPLWRREPYGLPRRPPTPAQPAPASSA
jgi:hypothetical protein